MQVGSNKGFCYIQDIATFPFLRLPKDGTSTTKVICRRRVYRIQKDEGLHTRLSV
jgi:hypothetical protein